MGDGDVEERGEETDVVVVADPVDLRLRGM